MNLRIGGNEVIRAMRAKAAIEERAIICHPFNDDSGRLTHTHSAKVLCRWDGEVFRMDSVVRVGTAAGIHEGRIVAMQPNRQYPGGVAVSVERRGATPLVVGAGDLARPLPA